MAQAVARARYLHIAPRKVRLVADVIRGKKVVEARAVLRFTVKGGAPLLAKVLESAVANAENAATEKNERVDTDEMVVKEITIDGGPVRKKYQPMPRGRAGRIRKRTSHVTLLISDKQGAAAPTTEDTSEDEE